jgi:hypothetical protein
MDLYSQGRAPLQSQSCWKIEIVAVLCIIMSTICCSCVDPFYVGGAVILPAGWPLASLTVPASAVKAPLFSHSQSSLNYFISDELVQTGTRYEAQLWAVGFSTDDSYNSVISYFDQCLPSDQYAVAYSGAINKFWISSDGYTEVRLNRKPNSSLYELEIHKYKHPHKPGHM